MRISCSRRSRSVMSLFVSRIATGRPCSSRRNDHRLPPLTPGSPALFFSPLSHLDDHLGSVGSCLLQLAVPTPGAKQFRVNLLDWRRKDRPQKLVSTLAN